MNQDQLFEQLLAAANRLADAAEIIARHIDPDAAKRLGKRLPDLRRPLADYAAFDWSSIGATIVARDRSGPTEVDYHGIVCKRRSGEGRKGKAIWFNVVTGGNVEDGNITYERLITFRDSTPAEPLAGQVEALIASQPQQSQQPPAPAPAPEPAPAAVTESPRQPAQHVPQSAAIPPTTTAAQSPAAPVATPDAPSPQSAIQNPKSDGPRSADHVKAWFVTQVKKYDAARPVNPADRTQVVEALNGCTDGQANAVIAFLCGCADVPSMKYPCVQSLRDWLRPARKDGHAVPANVMAIAEATAIVVAHEAAQQTNP